MMPLVDGALDGGGHLHLLGAHLVQFAKPTRDRAAFSQD
jgi:hypothetical protein